MVSGEWFGTQELNWAVIYDGMQQLKLIEVVKRTEEKLSPSFLPRIHKATATPCFQIPPLPAQSSTAGAASRVRVALRSNRGHLVGFEMRGLSMTPHNHVECVPVYS